MASHRIGVVVIETERLLMRRWRDEDRAPFAALNADPAVMEHMQGLMTRERSDAFIDEAAGGVGHAK